MNDHYEHQICCRNCGHHFTARIPKGTSVDGWLDDNRQCPNCGCETLGQSWAMPKKPATWCPPPIDPARRYEAIKPFIPHSC